MAYEVYGGLRQLMAAARGSIFNANKCWEIEKRFKCAYF